QAIFDVCGVRAWLHPDALLEFSVGQSKRPDWRRAFQAKSFNGTETLGVQRAAGPSVCAERILAAIVLRVFFELSNQQGAAQRWFQGGYKQPVITACQ